jgi:protein-tyrosine phosphatase
LIETALRNIAIFSGVEAKTLDDMESRLKADLLNEGGRNGGMTIIHEETKDQRVLPCWEAVSGTNVYTPQEIYADLHNEGFEVSFERLPAAPEGKFRKKTVAHMLDLLRTCKNDPTETVHIVFNCQLGMGRSTVAMVLAYLGLMPADATTFASSGSLSVSAEINLAASQAIASASSALVTDDPNGFEPYKRGEYRSILSLVRALEHGFSIKRAVDHAVDANGMFLNLREEIFKWKKSSELAQEVDRTVEDTQVALQRALSNLERYVMLNIFCAYVMENRPMGYLKGYRDWLSERRELSGVMDSIHIDPEHELTISADNTLDSYDAIISKRRGQVLTRGTILKADHFPSILRGQLIEGAPNFRRVKHSDIFATAMPSVHGISNVLRQIGEAQFPKEFIWVNLREEPVIYINSQPYVLRNAETPMRNLTLYEGITGDQLEKMEVRFKDDILAEIKQHQGQVLIHDETESRQLAASWVRVTEVRTTREVFDTLLKEGFHVHYARIPVTTEKSPEVKDFDELVHLMTRADNRFRKVIFNCQIGRGRSTTGTVIAFLIKYYIQGLVHSPDQDADGAIALFQQQTPKSPPASPARRSTRGGNTDETADHAPKTDFAITNALVRLLKDGQRMKRLTDWAIDQCAATQNLRLTILGFLRRADSARTTEELNSYIERAAGYLERYFWLIVFNSYLSECWKDSFIKSFDRWLQERPELKTLMKEIHHAPQVALQVSKLQPIDRSDPRTLVAHRVGNVLAAGTILKFDHFPGCQRKGLEPVIEGAPNFRKVDGLNVYGVAIPTIDGVQNVLRYLEAGPSGKTHTLWVNLREEPIVYVNGRPYVVRSEHRAYENLEHTGINTQRIEQMEVRLVDDLTLEARTHDGNVVLHDENSNGDLIPHWEPVPGDDCARQPRRVYEDLVRDGWQVLYNRVGITDEQSPTASEFDELLHIVSEADPAAHLIFNCQMGRGRTTTGMVIACMYKRWLSQPAAHRETLAPGDGVLSTKPLSSLTLPNAAPSSPMLSTVEWKLIARGVRALSNGVGNRAETDVCIDLCNVMQNLRDAIKALKTQAEAAADPLKRPALEERAINYLKRYYYLILFSAYLHEYAPAPGYAVFKTSFQQWLHSRPELVSIVEKPTLAEINTSTPLLAGTPALTRPSAPKIDTPPSLAAPSTTIEVPK